MAYVVTEGSLVALSRPMAMPTTTLRLSDSFTADYAHLWRTQGAVRTTTSFLARTISDLGLHLYRRISDTDRERVTDHPLARLISKPNPRTTRYRLINALVHDLAIFDQAYWLKVKTGDAASPQGLVRLPSKQVTPVGKNWLWPEAFEFAGTTGKKEFGPEEVVYFHGYNPDGDLAGSSPIEALRRVLAEEHEAGVMREQTLRNGARMSGYLTRPPADPAKGISAWSDEARERFARGWTNQYTANGAGAMGTPILEEGMTFVPASQTSEQLQYIESRKLTREEVAGAYFIPPPMVGIMDSATFSNITEQHKMLYQDTLGPWLTMIAQELELQLFADFEDTEGLYLEFNLQAKLAGSFEEQATVLSAGTGAPYLTRNEARARQNLPRIDGGDELVVPLNVLIGGQASPQDSAPKAGHRPRLLSAAPRTKNRAPETYEKQTANVLEKFFSRQGAAVLSALGSDSDGTWWDAKRWDKELADDLFGLAVLTTTQVGQAVAEGLGFDPEAYDVDRTLAFLAAVAKSRAEMINSTTQEQITAALAAEDEEPDEGTEPAPTPADVFEDAKGPRALAAAATLVTTFSSFATTEAAVQTGGGKTVKTWITSSGNPRASHAAMDGETVPISDLFSNGMNWPGDPAGGPDEVAGCMCGVEVSIQ